MLDYKLGPLLHPTLVRAASPTAWMHNMQALHFTEKHVGFQGILKLMISFPN